MNLFIYHRDQPRTSLLLILLPLLAAFIGERVYNVFVDPEVAIFVSGYHVHHLFFGILLALPAAFALAFGVAGKTARRACLVALGAGAGFILDEFVAMIATDMSTQAYLGRVSLWGAIVMVALFSVLLVALAYRAGTTSTPES